MYLLLQRGILFWWRKNEITSDTWQQEKKIVHLHTHTDNSSKIFDPEPFWESPTRRLWDETHDVHDHHTYLALTLFLFLSLACELANDEEKKQRMNRWITDKRCHHHGHEWTWGVKRTGGNALQLRQETVTNVWHIAQKRGQQEESGDLISCSFQFIQFYRQSRTAFSLLLITPWLAFLILAWKRERERKKQLDRKRHLVSDVCSLASFTFCVEIFVVVVVAVVFISIFFFLLDERVI